MLNQNGCAYPAVTLLSYRKSGVIHNHNGTIIGHQLIPHLYLSLNNSRSYYITDSSRVQSGMMKDRVQLHYILNVVRPALFSGYVTIE